VRENGQIGWLTAGDLATSMILMRAAALFFAMLTTAATVRAEEPERHGVSFGAAFQLGYATTPDVGGGAALRVGWAVSQKLVALVEYNGLFFGKSDAVPDSPGDHYALEGRELLTIGVRFWPAEPLWLMAGGGLGRASGTHSFVPSSLPPGAEPAVDRPQTWGPALIAGLGIDVVQWRHGALDLALVGSAWQWNDALRADVALMFGYSYY
jgi:hypothetical protein